jgi:ubiquinone/menaquinone biosynthesis C-methylase UbiE
MKRRFDPQSPELMDRPQPATPALRDTLANLASLNAHFGSHRLVRRFLGGWLNPGRCYRVLDLCTGAGDIPRLMLDWARSRDIVLRIDAVDANPSTVQIAIEQSADYPEIRYSTADVLKYEGPESYDLVCCSLALHHFSETDAVRLLQRCRELSHHYVLVSDLERSVPATVGIWALTALLYTEEMTRVDGRLSAQRAFSFREFRGLAESAGWPDFGHARFLWCRQALWLDSRKFEPIAEEAISASMPSPA